MSEFAALKELFSEILNVNLKKAVFSSQRRKSLEYSKVLVRPITLKGMLAFQFEYVYEKKAIHQNLWQWEAEERCVALVAEDFKHVNIFTLGGEIQVLAAKAESPRISRTAAKGAVAGADSKASKIHQKSATPGATGGRNLNVAGARDMSAAPGTAGGRNLNAAGLRNLDTAVAGCAPDSEAFAALSHNRTKKYIIPDGVPCDFLIELGVMGEDGKVFKRSYNKFRQINRYLEIVEAALKDAPELLAGAGTGDGGDGAGAASGTAGGRNLDAPELLAGAGAASGVAGAGAASGTAGGRNLDAPELLSGAGAASGTAGGRNLDAPELLAGADASSEAVDAGTGTANAGKRQHRPFRVIDFGCGKAYLTFALYYYLKVQRSLEVEIVGLDLKKDVIEFCGRTAEKLGYNGLKFLHGDIADYESDGADMVVTLHACDTATDYALANAVKWHSRIILSVPCCQHELFKQIKSETLHPVLKHGILKDRFTEILTDGLRGLKLESRGYDVAMIEFTSLEHTARNIMIRATLQDPDCVKKRTKKAQEEYDSLCREFSLNPTTSII